MGDFISGPHRLQCNGMATVAITSSSEQDAKDYAQVIGTHASSWVITPEDFRSPAASVLKDVHGLLLTDGPDIDPSFYGELPLTEARHQISTARDTLEMHLLNQALERDMPVLGICRGMQLLNVGFGGKLLQDIPGHDCEATDGESESPRHLIYLSPGSKLAAILGMGGFFRVNSQHHQGLREAQKSPRLLASAYCLEDAIIEGLESPEHGWVVGVQCHPELQDEVPKVFGNLFVSFAERAEAYGRARER